MGSLYRLLLMAALFAGVLPAVFSIGHELEGRVFPVVSKLEIIDAQANGTKSMVYVRFTKKRECVYDGIGWYWVNGSQLSRVAIDLKPQPGSSANRPVGTHISGPWEIDMPIERVKSNSYVTLTHRCHPFYITRTDIYP